METIKLFLENMLLLEDSPKHVSPKQEKEKNEYTYNIIEHVEMKYNKKYKKTKKELK